MFYNVENRIESCVFESKSTRVQRRCENDVDGQLMMPTPPKFNKLKH